MEYNKEKLFFWSHDLPKWNFGDAITVLLHEELFYGFKVHNSVTHIVGSVVSDGLVPMDVDDKDGSLPSWRGTEECKVVYWGCGIREPGSLDEYNHSRVEFLAVRGPLSASDLRLGADVPLGDSGLFLPALYEPEIDPRYEGKAVCIPHYNDTRSDIELLKQSGCDVVLRPAIQKSTQAIKRFINAVYSAKFVLSAALHGAIAAATYDTPFAYWENGYIDLPTKWADFSALVKIPMQFCPDLKEGETFYKAHTSKTLELPSLWPMLCSSPFLLRPSGFIKILRYELKRRGKTEFSIGDIDGLLNALAGSANHFNKIADQIADRTGPQFDQVLSRLKVCHAEINALAIEAASTRDGYAQLKEALDESRTKEAALEQQVSVFQSEIEQASASYNALTAQLALHEARAEELDHALTAMGSDKNSLQAQLDQTRQQLTDAITRLTKAEHELEFAQAEFKSLQDAKGELDQEFGRLTEEHEFKLAEMAALNLSLEQDRENLEHLIEQLKAESEAELAKIRHVNEEIVQSYGNIKSDFENTLIEAQQKEDRWVDTLTNVQDQKLSLETAIDSLNRALENARNEQLSLTRALTDKQKLIEEAHLQLGSLDGRVNGITEQYQATRLELDNTWKRLNEIEDKFNRANSRIGELQHQQELSNVDIVVSRSSLNKANDYIVDNIEHNIARNKGRRQKLLKLARLGRSNYYAKIDASVAKIENFLSQFEDHRLAMSNDGRRRRIIKYLSGVSPIIDDFPIFHRDIYYLMHPDVAATDMDPLLHFIDFGRSEKRSIHPLMDSSHYTTQYPETSQFDISPVEHFIRFGVDKNYNPSALFDVTWYFSQYPDVKLTGHNPLFHFLRYPRCLPHPLFDSNYYLQTYKDVATENFNPLAHYLLMGANEFRNPNPFFNTQFYLSSNPDIVGVNPLEHYVLHGYREGRRPSSSFDPHYYASTNPDLTGNPLEHFLYIGKPRGHAGARPINAAVVAATAPPHEDSPPIPFAVTPVAVPPHKRQTVLIIDAFYPHPDQDSGSLDQISYIRIFQKLGYSVAFCALLDFGKNDEYRQSLNQMGVHCITSDEYASLEEYLFLASEELEIALVSRVHFGGAWINRIKQLSPKSKIIFNTVDLHHVREEREAELSQNFENLSRAAETKKLEFDCIQSADYTIVVSTTELEILNREMPNARIAMVPLIRDISFQNFSDFEQRKDIAFIGGFQHQPNIDAVIYFLENIWPLVLNILPDVRFNVIGSHLPESLSKRTDRNVSWIGYLPELEPSLKALRLTVAPLRYGAGAKGKVVSSLANGVPVIASLTAAEGMGLEEGASIMVGKDPQDFADKILAVYQNKNLWQNLSQSGFLQIKEKYSLDRGVELLKEILNKI